MPERSRVAEFIATVVSNDHVGAIRDFYTEDATMRENLGEPRRGRELLMQHERKALDRAKQVITHEPRAVLIDGDRVVIHWVFDFVGKDGVTRRIEELAIQTWRADRIAEEQFFYDTATAFQPV
jgi:ketosteroid isomerase-like protein